MKTLSHYTSKCLSCNWSGEPQDIFCSVDKSHKTARLWAWYDKENSSYSYSHSNLECD
ncbi:MAG: hypothetical protein RIT47_802 [Pseudomonadota bacterium]|jgi:hypothetical protein